MKHQNYWNLLELEGESKKFKYLHGIEMEYFLLDKDLSPVKSNKPLKALVDEAFPLVKDKIKANKKYQEKVKKLGIGSYDTLKHRSSDRDLKKIRTIFLEYQQKDYDLKSNEIDILGKDTNIGTGGFITLELVTPPCCCVNELKWWLKTLLKSTIIACKTLDLELLFNAGHPKIKRNYCGEHHHVGIPYEDQKLKIYNIMRLFLPLISIFTYSHFEDPKNQKLNINQHVFSTKISNQFIRGSRLKNTNQIKPVAPLNNLNKEEFSQKIGLNLESCRMVDMYPFTDFNTLEIRIFDTQISIIRTISVAIMLQAICRLSLCLSNTYIRVLNKIFPLKLYNLIRREYIKNGFLSIQKSRLYNSFYNQIKNICAYCVNNNSPKCNKKKLKNLKCKFRSQDLLFHNLVSYLLFPKRFLLNGRYYGSIEKKITAKDSFKQFLYLIKPFLIEMGLNNFLSLKVIRNTLRANFSPSMYWLIEYQKNNFDLEKYFKQVLKHQERVLNEEKTIWGIYYDPYLKLESKNQKINNLGI